MSRYVIFKQGRMPGKGYNEEIYVRTLFADSPGTTNEVEYAIPFPSASAAYSWGGRNGLDDWRVGVR